MELIERAELVQRLLARPIAYHRIFADVAGGALAGLLLSQMFYWSKNLTVLERDGWFFKSQQEWLLETGLTRWEQETARKRLVRRGLIQERRTGVPSRLWFRVCTEALIEAMMQPGLPLDE